MSHLLCQANALRIPLADESVQCCVTSPPYWGLRDYGVAGQLGLEARPDEFVAKMVAVFREVKRVLRDDGTCWVNMGDSYAGSWGAQSRPGNFPSSKSTLTTNGGRGPKAGDKYSALSANQIAAAPKRTNTGTIQQDGLKPKDLVGIPWRLAFALQADGWYLRSDIIWAKPNPMPESVTDRPTKSHEYLFLLSKSERYYFDQEAVREEHKAESLKRYEYGLNVLSPADGFVSAGAANPRAIGHCKKMADNVNPAGRNIRTVWSIPTESYPGSHFATYPRKLVEPCIKAGTSEKGCCPVCGAGWVREVESERVQTRPGATTKTNGHTSEVFGNRDPGRHVRIASTTGWHPGCSHDAAPVPCVVLDPFSGSGTTGVVANALGRSYVGLDLNAEYIELATRRISRPHAAVPRPGKPEHHPLFGDPA